MIFFLSYCAQGITLGFTAGVTPGPFQTLIITETLTYGWRRSLPLVLSPLISDGPMALLVLFVLVQLSQPLLHIIQVGGGLFILYMAWGNFMQLRKGLPSTAEALAKPPPHSIRDIILRGAVANFLNPAVWLFWSTILGPIVINAWHDSPVDAAGFLAAFYGLIVAMYAVVVVIFQQARKLDERVVRVLLTSCILVMTAFGVLLLKSAVVG